ncbi:response regulator [Thermodesulfatator atlanticus]|uniref:response regulator n=1 Tax=Thermodesulfatator atlanticus TaxID=501497 RepID=UPI0003B42E73|nr:response regulator [Thermodesulfatator atlanticus]
MRKVLIVEDDSGVRELLTEFFDMLGFDAYPAETISKALETIKDKGPFALYVLDIRLPEADGLELAQHIRKRYQEPIIFLTGLINAETEVYAQKVPNSRYLRKPVTLETIKKVLKELGVYQCQT